jgi:hypothetical protein
MWCAKLGGDPVEFNSFINAYNSSTSKLKQLLLEKQIGWSDRAVKDSVSKIIDHGYHTGVHSSTPLTLLGSSWCFDRVYIQAQQNKDQ